MNLGLEQKVVWVTGSSRGIGRAIAGAFAGEGARVVISGRDGRAVDAAVREIGKQEAGQARGFVGDLTHPPSIEQCLRETNDAWGKVDILVANLGSGRGQPLLQADLGEWRSMLDLNLLATVAVVRSTVAQMPKGGNIVLVASIAGLEDLGAPLAYTAAKSGLIATGKALARQLAHRGIRVNTVAPGNVYFPGGTWAARQQADPEGVTSMLRQEVPWQRFGEPQEVASVVIFLASDRASFVSGACVTVDGAQSRAW